MFSEHFLKYLIILYSTVTYTLASYQMKTITYEALPTYDNMIDMENFVKIGAKYYLIETNVKVNWYEAVHQCRTYDANLATIESAEEWDALSNYLVTQNVSSKLFWTSGNDLGNEGNYRWLTTGQRIQFIRWKKGMPDNFLDNENCLHLTHEEDDDFVMNDIACKDEWQYICQANNPKMISLLFS